MATNKRLSATIVIGGALGGSLQTAFGKTTGLLKKLGQTVTDLEKRQRLLGKSIQEFGRAGKDVDGLRNSYVRLTSQLDRARQAQERLSKAQATHSKLNGIGSKVKSAGIAVGASGVAIGASLIPGIREGKAYQNEVEKVRALGFSSKDASELVKFAKDRKSYGVSTVAATETARDLAAAFGDTHHATSALPLALKQRFALGLYDQANGTNLAEHAAYSMGKVIELRNGTKSEAEYNKQANMAHQVMVATGGRVNGEEMQHALRTGGIALKGLDDKAFYYGGSHLMQEMGGDTYGTSEMSLYQALAQGRITKRAAQNLEKFGLIGDKSKVKHDKAGQMSFMNPGALLGYETFIRDRQAWVEKYFIPTLKKHGIDPDDMTKVAEIAGMIISNRTGANNLVTRTSQRAVIAKEAANAERADNIEQGFNRNKGTASGKEADAEAKLADLKLRIGNSIMPTYIRALELTAGALDRLNKFADENPKLMGAITVGIGGLAVGAVAAAPVLLTAGTALQIIAAFKLARAVASLGALGNKLNDVNGAATGAIGGKGKGLLGFIGTLGLVVTASALALEAARAMGLPDTDQKKGMDYVKKGDWWNASFYLPAGDFLSEGWKAMTGGNSGAKAPDLPQPFNGRYGGHSGPPSSMVNVGGINIYQNPGEGSAELARRVADEIKRQNGINNRSNMFDGAH